MTIELPITITLSAGKFLNAIVGASHVASDDSMLPALCAVALTVDTQRLRVESTNRFHAIRTNLPISNIDASIESPTVLISTEDVKAWAAAIKKISKRDLERAEVTITLDTDSARLEVNQRAYEVPTVMGDYPRLAAIFAPKPYQVSDTSEDGEIAVGLSMGYLNSLYKIDKGSWKFVIENRRIRAFNTAGEGDTPQWEYLLMGVRLPGASA